jgi:hypothetical protein
MTRKLKPSEDPSFFEYEPNEDNVSDEELCQLFYALEEDPEAIKDPVFKKSI